jgi:hypothetical protein
MIAVSGDPLRTNAYVFAHNGILGYRPRSRSVCPPADVEALWVVLRRASALR